VQRRSGRILERVADRIAHDGGLMRCTAFPPRLPASMNFFALSHAPPPVFQDEGHENAHNRSHHERGPEGLTGGNR